MMLDMPIWPEQSPTFVTFVSSGGVDASRTLAQYLSGGSASALQPPEDEKLNRLKSLEKNWDFRGSLPPNPVAIEAARHWIEALRETVAQSGFAWITPHVSASEAGEVTLEWWRNARKITLYFGAVSPEYVRVWGPHIFEEMDSGIVESPDSFTRLWFWLNAA